MGGWLSGGLAAARLAADRAELWLPGALVSFAAVGWLVLLLTVAPLPDAASLAVFALQVAASPWWPWNVVVLALAFLSGLATLLLVVAFGEVVLLMGLSDRATGRHLPTVPRAMAVLGLAAIPVVAALVALGWLAAPSVIDAVSAPGSSAPLGLQVLEVAWPFLLGLAAVIVVAQAFGAATLRQPGGRGPLVVGRRWPRLVALAAVTLAAFVIGQLATAGVLGILWTPLQDRLTGDLAQPTTLILLLGFVWIWLVLVIMAGVVQAWTSAWWNAELGAGSGAESITRDSMKGDP